MKLIPPSCPFTGITELSFANSILAIVLNSKVTYIPLMLPLSLTAPIALMFLKPSNFLSSHSINESIKQNIQENIEQNQH
jgi:hypothetical protein